MAPNLVIIDYQELQRRANDPESSSSHHQLQLAQQIEAAFGPNGLGILGIRNVPGLLKAKANLFPMAHTLAHLPLDYLEENLTDAASLYNVGWSRGKEILNGGQPDRSKGSFYYCPASDTPGSPQERLQYPLSYPTNKWPPPTTLKDDNTVNDNNDESTTLPPKFEGAAKRLGTLLKDVVVDVARHLDFYCQQRVSGYASNTLYDALVDSPKVKARLLYYYPQQEATNYDENDDNINNKNAAPWIGWHHDSGFLTALAGEWFVNDVTGETIEQVPTGAGLYIATTTKTTTNGSRSIQEHHINLPPDCMAVQIGECAQIISGGALVATPHAVIAGQTDNTLENTSISNNVVARISLACFVDTPPSYLLSPPPGCTRQDILQVSHPDPRVPPLSERWTGNDMTFGDFLRDTFAMYYEWQPTPPSSNLNDSIISSN